MGTCTEVKHVRCQGKSLSLAFLEISQGRDLGIWEKQLLWLQPSRHFVPSPPAGSTGHSPGDAEARPAAQLLLPRQDWRGGPGEGGSVPGSLRGSSSSSLLPAMRGCKRKQTEEPKLNFGLDLLSPTTQVQIEYICFQTV